MRRPPRARPSRPGPHPRCCAATPRTCADRAPARRRGRRRSGRRPRARSSSSRASRRSRGLRSPTEARPARRETVRSSARPGVRAPRPEALRRARAGPPPRGAQGRSGRGRRARSDAMGSRRRVSPAREGSGSASETPQVTDPREWQMTRSRASNLSRLFIDDYLYVAARSIDLVAHVAGGDVVVDDPARLHRRVDRRRPDETKPGLAQAFRQLDRPGGLRGPRRRRRPVGPVAPDELRQRRLRLPQRDSRPRVRDRRLDLAAMADDARVLEQALDVRLAEAGDGLGVEPCERGPEALALAEDRQPREAGLEALEAKPLEQAALVADRPT